MEVSELIFRVDTDWAWPGNSEVIRAGGNRKERTYRMEKTYGEGAPKKSPVWELLADLEG